MTRIVKKTVSAVMVLVMTVGILITGDSGILHAHAADTAHINNKYIKEIGNGEYSTGVAYGDGIILLSNVTDSTYSGKNNVGTKVSLSSDSKMAFVDKDGINHVLNNKDENGNKKFDAIYGVITQTYYKYNIVEKNSKLGAIDNYGKQITLNGKEWYDNIYVYDSVDNGKFYGLVQNTSEDVFDFTLMGEDGNVVYTMKDCMNMNEFVFSEITNNKWSQHSYFILFNKMDGKSTLIDFSGKIWHEGDFCEKILYKSKYGDKKAVLQFSDSYGLYNYDTGDVIEKTGNIVEMDKSSDKYLAYDDKTTTIYDSNMKEELLLQGVYYGAKSINVTQKGKGKYALYDSNNNIVNVCDENGNKWFDEDVNAYKFDGRSDEGGIFTFADGEKYFVTDGRESLYKYSDIQSIAKRKMIGDESYDIKYIDCKLDCIVDFGIVFLVKNTISGESKNIVVTKKSGYTDAEIITYNGYMWRTTNSSRYYCILYYSEYVDKTIILKNGKIQKCDRKLIKAYNGFCDEIEEIDIPENLYLYSLIGSFYSESGDKYYLTSSGIKKDENAIYESVPYIFNVGNTGTYFYQSMKDNRYRVFDKNDNEIDIGLDKIYDGNNTNIYLSRGDLDGYFTLGYYNKDNQKTYKKLYTYKGEYIMDYSTYGYDECIRPYYGLAGTIYFIDNRAVRAEKIDFGILNDSELKEDSTIKIDTSKGTEEKAFSGLKENSTIEDIRKELPKLNITVVDSEGNELAASKPVGTGCKIQVIKDGKVVDTATVVVKGDTDGSGTIDVLDMEAVQKSILGIGEGLTGAYNEAAKLTGNDTLSVLDMEVIQKDILGLEKIN